MKNQQKITYRKAVEIINSENAVSTLEKMSEGGYNFNDFLYFTNIQGSTCLRLASYAGKYEVVKTLINKCHVDINLPQNKEALNDAIIRNKPKVIDFLLNKKIDIKHTDKNGLNAFMYAIIHNNDVYAYKLLSLLNKNSFEHKDNRGMTPLHLACKFNQLPLITTLLKNNCDSNTFDNEGENIFFAVLKNDSLLMDNKNNKVLDLLFSYNKNINHKNNEGETALMYAVEENLFKEVQWLLKNGADPNIKSNTGETALMRITISDHFSIKIMKELMFFNANPHIKNNDGEHILEVINRRNKIKRSFDYMYGKKLKEMQNIFNIEVIKRSKNKINDKLNTIKDKNNICNKKIKKF